MNKKNTNQIEKLYSELKVISDDFQEKIETLKFHIKATVDESENKILQKVEKDEEEKSEQLKELKKRIRSSRAENIKIFYPVIKAIGLNTATIVIFNIFFANPTIDLIHGSLSWDAIVEWHKIQVNWEFDFKFFCWITNCILLMLTYDAAMFATSFLNKTPTRLETLIFFAFIGFEFSLFAILFPNFFLEKSIADEMLHDSSIHPWHMDFKHWWFIIYGCYTLFINLFIWAGIYISTDKLAEFENEGTHNGMSVRDFFKNLKVLKNKKKEKMLQAPNGGIELVYWDWRERLFTERKQTFWVGLLALGIGITMAVLQDYYKMEWHYVGWVYIFFSLVFVTLISFAYFDFYINKSKLEKMIRETNTD